jgi:hypothetical protein
VTVRTDIVDLLVPAAALEFPAGFLDPERAGSSGGASAGAGGFGAGN